MIDLKDYLKMQQICDELRIELEKANNKHGHAPLATDEDVVLILVEELGEYAKALLQGNVEHARTELIQIASVALNKLTGIGPHRSNL